MAEDPETLRADKWLHHVRVFKSRSLAAQACQKGQVLLAGAAVKSSRALRQGDVLDVKRGDLLLRLRVLACPVFRIGAPRVTEYCENLTPAEAYLKASEARKERAYLHPTPQDQAAKPNKQQLRQLREWWEGQAE